MVDRVAAGASHDVVALEGGGAVDLGPAHGDEHDASEADNGADGAGGVPKLLKLFKPGMMCSLSPAWKE